jgi:hypothetical protein
MRLEARRRNNCLKIPPSTDNTTNFHIILREDHARQHVSHQTLLPTHHSSSTLDEGQKYRFSKRLVTDLDLHIATHNSHLINEKIESTRVRAENWEEIYDLRRKGIIIAREITFFRWKACKLYEEKLVYQAFT